MDSNIKWIQLLFGVILTGIVLTTSTVSGDSMFDVVEGKDTVLECRFESHLGNRGPTFYWTRTNSKDKDNVAIEGTPLEQNYEVDYKPKEGRYDLKIRNATYDRDNGKFECRIKEKGSGRELHSKTISLTVLLPPGLPKITPMNPIASEGRPFDITCSSLGGSPDPIIEWFKFGVPYKLDAILKKGNGKYNPTSAILRINPQKDDDGSKYRCVVWNRAIEDGRKLEASVSLNVNYYPRVSVGPENPYRVEKGSSANLTCAVDSKPSVNSVKWTRNGRFTETSLIYTIPRASLQDAGTYVCSADNGLGQPGEADLSLEVLYAPIVSVEPKKEVKEGENVWIKCNVSSNPRPALIEWVREGDSSFRQSGDILRIDRATFQHGGTYVCNAKNKLNPSGALEEYERFGNASIYVLIKHAPGKSFIDPPTPSVVEGSGITLTCDADPPGWPSPQFRWWKEGSEKTISVGAQLHISSAKASSEGLYFCQPSNEIGFGTAASVELRVFQAPRIISNLQSQVIRRAGDRDFMVSCVTYAKPRPSIRWLKDGVILDPSLPEARNLYRIDTQDIGIKNGAYTVNSTLHFTGIDREGTMILARDRGYYTCLAENEVRKEESHMYLRIQHEPIFQEEWGMEESKVAFDVGDTAYIPCKVQAFPKPEFEWSFNSLMLDTKHSRIYKDNLTILPNDVYVSTLILKGLKKDDYGEYVCSAINSIGNSSNIIMLQRKGKPSPPVIVKVLDSDTTSALLEWIPGFNGGYEDTSYLVNYVGPDGLRSDFDCYTYNPCNVTGLAQQSTYSFRVKARNKQGASNFSQNVTGKTKIDLARIPNPMDVQFEPDSKTLVFTVISPAHSTHAKVEVRDPEGSWREYKMLPLMHDNVRHVIEEGNSLEAVRVSLCYESDRSCGKYIQADFVNEVPALSQAGTKVHYLIGVVVSAIVILLSVGLILLFCCCRKKRIVKKEYESGQTPTSQSTPPPYYPNGMENKGMERTMDVIEDTLKNFNGQNGYISYNGIHTNGNGNIHFMDENSYSNSNNGGSVDSQDSLWKATPLVPNEQQQQQVQQQQHSMVQHAQGHHHGSMMHDEHRNSTYDHHPFNDNYSTYEQRNTYVSDPYGAIPKPKRRLDLIGDSPYHELSGLPDPYVDGGGGHGHMLIQEEGSSRPNQMMSFEESLESGYSTPNSRNRKVIREIIV